MTAGLHGPEAGYDTPEKNAMRDWVWSRIAGLAADGSGVRTGNVMFMPSLAGLEIELACNRGLAPSQCFVVDEKPAVVATLQRKYPGIRTYGVPVSVAASRLAKEGVSLLAANLDFCGRVSSPRLRQIAAVFDSGIVDHAGVFVTVLRGREDRLEQRLSPLPADAKQAIESIGVGRWWVSDCGLSPTESDIWRIWSLSQAAGRQRAWTSARAYVSPNGQSFLTVWFPAPDDLSDGECGRGIAMDGSNCPRVLPNERFNQYRSRLSQGQRVRLASVAYAMGATEASVFAIWRDTDAAVQP